MARKDAKPGVTEATQANRVRAMRLRIAGKTCPAIAAELGVSRQSAFRYVQTALAQLGALQEKEARQLRDLERARLDAVQEALWPSVEAGDVKACLAVIRLIAARAKLLGLNAPEKHDHRVIAAAAVQEKAKEYRELSLAELQELCRRYIDPE